LRCKKSAKLFKESSLFAAYELSTAHERIQFSSDPINSGAPGAGQ